MDLYIFLFILAFLLTSYRYKKGNINRAQFFVWIAGISLGLPRYLQEFGFEGGFWDFLFTIVLIVAVVVIILNLPAAIKGRKKKV